MKEKIFKNLGYVIVLLDVLVYFIVSYVAIDSLNIDLVTIIVNGALLFIGAMIANSAMLRQGILTGHESHKFQETAKAHIVYKKKIFPRLKHFQPWLDNDYYTLLRLGRTVYVNSAGTDYDKVFYENGKVKTDFKLDKPKKLTFDTKWQRFTAWIRRPLYFIFGDEWRIFRQRKKLIRLAKRYKITRLTVTDIFSINNSDDPNGIKVSENKYIARQDAFAFMSRIIFSILFQSVSFVFNGFNLSTFFMQLLSVILILLTSTFSMLSAYLFVVRTLRNSILKKIDKMEEFYNANIEMLKEDKNVCPEESLSTQSDVVEETDKWEKVAREEEDIRGYVESRI